MANEGQWPKANGDIFYASEANLMTIESGTFVEMLWTSGMPFDKNFVALSPNHWVCVDSTDNDIKATNNAGSTWWTAFTGTIARAIEPCGTNGSYALAFNDVATDQTVFTTNLGSTWAIGSYLNGSITQVFDMNYADSGLVWIVGSRTLSGTAVRCAAYSVNFGENFINVGAGFSGTEVCTSVSFKDVNNGFILCADGSVFATHTGGSSWYKFGSSPYASGTQGTTNIYAVSSSGCVIKNNNGLMHSVSGISPAPNFHYNAYPGIGAQAGYFFQPSNGNVYFILFGENTFTNLTLFKSKDGGKLWSFKDVGGGYNNRGYFSGYNPKSHCNDCGLFGTNKVVFKAQDDVAGVLWVGRDAK